MSDTPVSSFAGQAWPEDEGWVRVGDWSPDPVEAGDGDDDSPRWRDDERFCDEDLLATGGQVSAWDVVLLSSIDPWALTTVGKLDYLRRVEAMKSLVAAMEATATVAMAGSATTDTRTDRYVAMEVSQLRRVGESAAYAGIATARSLHREFPAFLAALSAGEVSEWHCRVLVSETAHVTDPATIAALQERLLPKAKRRTPTEFRREIRSAVADLDAEREAERVARARSDRYVACRQLPDGLGYLGIVSDWPTISAMHQRVVADGRALQLARGGAKAARDGDDDALADSCRADALAARVLGAEQPDGTVVLDPSAIPVSLTIVMDLPTLRGEADRHALLDGEPVPAGVAREYADVAATWRRAVTDPVTGHLLDYGSEQYLPARLRDYVLARDLCRVPGCTARGTSRLEMDHALPFPEGVTSAANCGGLCRAHHQQKTDRLADVEHSCADGSATWITQWGQRIAIPPRPFLHDPADHLPAEPGNATAWVEPPPAADLLGPAPPAQKRPDPPADPPF